MSMYSPRLDPGCQYFRQTRDPQSAYMEINLLLSSINRGLSIQHREVSSSRTVTCQITSSIVTVQKETTNQSLQPL